MSAVDAWLGQQPGSTTPQNAAAVDAWLGVAQQPANVNPPPIPQSGGMPKSGAQIGSKSGVDTANTLPQGWTAPNSLLMGIGDAVRGGATGITKGLSWLANEVAPNSQFAKDASAAIPQMQQATAAQNAQYDAQRAAQGGSGIDLGRLAGQVVGTAPTMAIGPEYAGLNLAGKIGVGAMQGASGGAILGGGDPAQTTIGGLLGAAGPLMAAGSGAVGRGLWNAAEPVLQPERFVGRGIAGAMDPAEAAAAAANIRSAPQFVPGYQPGTAALAQSPFLIQTEKAAGNLPVVKTALMNRNLSNNAAIWDTINGVAGTPLDLQNAIAARDMATTPLYNIAKQQTIPVDAPMTDLMTRPAMASAVKRAQTLASNTNAGPIFSTSPLPNMLNGGPSSVTTLTGRGAQDIKEALDAMLLPQNTQNLSNKEIGALNDTRAAYMSWLEGHSPEFTAARQLYAGMSPPINSMQAAQGMADRLGSFGRSIDANQNPIITAPGYASALDMALKSQEFGIEPAAQTTLENAARELQRSTALNSVPKTGSDTAYNLAANGWLARNLFGPTFGGTTPLGRGVAGLAVALGGHPWLAAGLASGMGKIGQTVGGRLQGRLAGLLDNPNAILPYLDARAAAPVQAIPGPLMQGLLNYGRPAVVNGLIGGFNKPGNQ